MIRRHATRVLFPVFAGLLLTGCMPKMTMEQMKEMMPKRPAELDLLDAFEGTWETTTEMKFAGLDEVIHGHGTTVAKWGGDKWYLVNHGSFSMGDLGEMKAVETWAYDAKSKVFRTSWVDSMGSTGTGTARRDAKTGIWHMRAVTRGPFGKSSAKGTVKFIDANTNEWTWTEYVMGGLIKTVEMKGTARKK